MIVALTAGATLAVSACRKDAAPEPEVPEPPVMRNPPPPELEEPVEPPTPVLPTWDAVGSNHPEGATNPPRPVLVVDPDGRCFKDWAPSMLPPKPENSDRVQKCGADDDCGTQVVCPEKAAKLLADWKAEKE